MGVESMFYSLDKSKVHITSGDLPKGFWTLTGTSLVKAGDLNCCRKDTVESDVLPVQLDGNILSMDLQNIKDINWPGAVAGAGIGAAIGLRFFGPMGLLGGAVAGHVISGGRTEVHVNCILHDGRSFTAVMKPSTFERFKVITRREATAG